MIDKRLMNLLEDSKKHVIQMVVWNWIALLCNVVFIFSFAYLLENLISNTANVNQIITVLAIDVVMIAIRFICHKKNSEASFNASAEVIQVSGEGVEQLESLQGLTTLKIYNADARRTVQMDKDAESFYKITMRVLTMQLNSISVMDLIAYGGTGLGIIIALSEFSKCNIGVAGLFVTIMLSSEFFIPLSLLATALFAKGSTRFHKWFISTKIYKDHIEEFIVTKSMTLKKKLTILLPVSAMMMVVFFTVPISHARIAIIAAILFKYYYFFFNIKTV